MSARVARPVVVALVAALAGFGTGAAFDALAGPSPLPACVTEDAPGPCRWDATEHGDGAGRSFTVLPDGTVVYDDEAPVPA